MKNKSFENFLYSTLGVVAMAAVLIAFYYVAGSARHAIDLTKEKAYPLSAGTRAILGKLESPVTVRFYCTQGQGASADVVYLKGYARRVEDLLAEYKQAARGKLI